MTADLKNEAQKALDAYDKYESHRDALQFAAAIESLRKAVELQAPAEAHDDGDELTAAYMAGAHDARKAHCLTTRQIEVLTFLAGEGTLDGHWFEPDRKPKFWWRTALREAFGADVSKAQPKGSATVEQWEAALSAVMPADFKDWWQNSRREWPAVAAAVIETQRADRDLGWEMAAKAPAAQAPAPAQSAAYLTGDGKLHVTAWECHGCGHRGIDDGDDAAEACSDCNWRGPCPDEDVCPGCGREGTMVSACPKCGDRYYIKAEADIVIPTAAQAPAVAHQAPPGYRLITEEFMDWIGALPEAKAQRRLEWLHSPESNNVDGYEWGVYRVKWEHGKAVEVWHTNSDFSDLDAAMASQPPVQGRGS